MAIEIFELHEQERYPYRNFLLNFFQPRGLRFIGLGVHIWISVCDVSYLMCSERMKNKRLYVKQ